MVSLEYKTYIACTGNIAGALAPVAQDISAPLLEKGLIPPNVAEKVRWEGTIHGKATELVSAVGAAISNDREAYHDFLEILVMDRYYPDTATTVKLLLATYENGGVRPGLYTTGGSGKMTLLRDTGRRLAKEAVRSAIKKAREENESKAMKSAIKTTKKVEEKESGETKTIHVILALAIVCVAIGAGLFTYHVNEEGAVTNNGVCTKIANMPDLQAAIEKVVAKEGGVSPTKICQHLDLPSETCTDEMKPSDIALKYFDKNDNECWEEVVKTFCKDLDMKDVAKEVADKYGVPEVADICQ